MYKKLGGINILDDDNVYYCKDRNLVMQCDKLSQYVLPNGKCWNAEVGNKICKTGDGWIEVVNDIIIMESLANAKHYLCNETKCVTK